MSKFIKRFSFRKDPSQNDCKNKCDLNVEDFFSFRQYQICGFPNKPSCLAVDKNLGLLAIGTQHGYLHIYGKPGVHFQAFLNKKITHIVFLTGKLHVITLTEDSVMVLWKIITHKEGEGLEPITVEPKHEVFAIYLDSKNKPIVTQPIKSDNIIEDTQTPKVNNDANSIKKKNQIFNTEPFLHKVLTRKYDFLKKNTLSSFCVEERCIGGSASLHEQPSSNNNNNINKNTLIDNNMDTHSVVAKLYFGMSDGCLYIVDLYNNESYERNKNNSRISSDDLANYNNDNNNDLKKPYHMLLPDDILENFFSTDVEMYLGSVACIMLHPLFPHKLMVGYSMGVIALWSLLSYTPESVHNSYQKLEHLSFNHDGSEFISSHSDGSYIIWNTSDSSQPREPAYTPYGPYQCGSIDKFVWKTNESCSLMVFSGGMPKSGYGDRWVVSLMKGGGDEDESHVVLDITSKIIDFLVLDNEFNECLVSSVWCTSDNFKGRTNRENDGKSEVNFKRGANRGNKSSHPSYTTPKPASLVILSEEEVVVVDLQSNEWPSYRLPHLTSPHCSAITSLFHATDVPEEFMTKVREAGKQQEMKSASYSRKTWPFLGGNSVFTNEKDNDLLLSGHEDGTVRFWQTTQDHIQLLYRVCTAHLFGIDVCNHLDALNDSDDDWPPFKKVGSYNPFTDDPRLAIRQVILSTTHKPESLLLAGTAGQVILCEFREATKGGKLIKEAEAKNITEDTEEKVKKDKNLLVGDNKTSNNNNNVADTTQIYVGDTIDVKDMDLNDKNDVRLLDGFTIEEKEVDKKETKIDAEINCHFRTSSSSSTTSSSSIKLQVKVSTVNLVNNGDDFLWMGHAPLEVTNHGGNKIRNCPSSASPPVFNPSSLFTPESIAAASSVYFSVHPNDAGFHASSIVLVHPPVSFTALALHAPWNLFAFGSECGFGLFDYIQNTLVFSKTSKIESNKGVNKSNTASTPISSVHQTGALRGMNNVLKRTWRASMRGLQRARSDLKEKGARGQEAILRSLSALRCLPGQFKSRTSNAHAVNNADHRPPSMLNKIKNVLCRPVRGAQNTASNPQPATTMSSKHATLDSANHTYTKPSSSSCSSIYPRTSSEARRGSCEDIFTKASTFERDPKIASLSRLGTPIIRCLYFAENTQLDAADVYNGETVNTVVTVYKNKTTTAVASPNTVNNDTTLVANVSASNNDQPLLIPSNTTLKSADTLVETTASTITAATVISPESCNATNQNVSDLPSIPASSAFFGTFWVGTSRGLLSMFNLVLPPCHLRLSHPVQCSLAKEIQLKQDAPIIDVCLVNKSGEPVEKLFLNNSSDNDEIKNKHKNKKSKFPLSIFSSLFPASSGQCLIVCSQKQVKVFSYPGLKSKRKVKMSANGRLQEIRKSPSKGGSNQNTLQNNIAKVAYTHFRHKDDVPTKETGLVCMLDDGDACIYSLPMLHMRFYTPGVINKKYFSDLKLCVLTSNGGGYYLCSPSEFQKFSLSATTPYLKTIHLPARSEELARNESEKGMRNIKNSKNSKKSSSDDSHDSNLQRDMLNNISSGDPQNKTCKIVINADDKNSLVTIENNSKNNATNDLNIQKDLSGVDTISSNANNNNITNIDKESKNNNKNESDGASACINDSSSSTNENSYNNNTTEETSHLNVTTNEYIRSMDEEKLEKIISRFATLDSSSAKFSEPKKHIVLSLPRQPKQPLVSRSSGSSSSVVPCNVVVNTAATLANAVESNNTSINNVDNTNIDIHSDTNVSHDKELRKANNSNTYI